MFRSARLAHRRAAWTLAAIAALALAPLPATAGGGPAAFDRLKTLEGTWHGHGAGHEGEAMEVIHVFRVSANGSVVMETMNPGTQHEMINMYHLDGDSLVLTHYCAGGNQPTMKLGAGATPTVLPFEFTGGTNLDPAKDAHIHSARLSLRDDGTLLSAWTAWAGGREAQTTTFELHRDEM